jgi:hypothetical protein
MSSVQWGGDTPSRRGHDRLLRLDPASRWEAGFFRAGALGVGGDSVSGQLRRRGDALRPQQQ